jgi:hypothetical protein
LKLVTNLFNFCCIPVIQGSWTLIPRVVNTPSLQRRLSISDEPRRKKEQCQRKKHAKRERRDKMSSTQVAPT